MATKLVVVVLKGRGELVRSVAPAPIDDHHNLFADGAEVAITGWIDWRNSWASQYGTILEKTLEGPY